MAILIGIDIGTQGTKTAAFDADGTLLASAFEPSRLMRPKHGVVEEDPARQFSSVCRTIQKCVADAGIDPHAVTSIGIDGQMAGVIGVGADGRHVTPYDSWLDTRCASSIDRMLAKAGPLIVARTGGPPSFNHGPKKLWWREERPADYRRIAAFVQPGGYAAMRLCGLKGNQSFIDHTYLHFSGFADTARGAWDDELCQLFRFDAEKLPRIVEPQSIVGQLSATSARACGLAAGVPVVAGCGDTAASLLACGAVKPGVCVDVAGTASVFAATTRAFVPDVQRGMLSCARSATPGLWHPYAYVNGGGMNLEWFRSLAAGVGPRGAAALSPVDLSTLDRLAGGIPLTEDLPIFVPHLAGRNSPPQTALRGAWTGLTHDHGVAALYRAVLEGVALEYAVYTAAINTLAPSASLRELRVTGGGAASGTWNAIKADVLQLAVRPVTQSQGAAAGAAIIAGWGTGVFSSPEAAARRWVSVGAAVRPRRSAAAVVKHRLARYQSLLQSLDPHATMPARAARTQETT